MPSRKPTLALATPVSASFPAEALKSAASVRTPHSALSPSRRDPLLSAGLPSAGLPSGGYFPSAGLYSPMVAIKIEEGLVKTPITPPMAYMDFLKMAGACSMPSPSATKASSTATKEVDPKDAAASKKAAPKEEAVASNDAPADTKTAPKAARANTNPNTAGAGDGGSKPDTALSSAASSVSEEDDKERAESSPSSAASNATECSCSCERLHKSPKVVRIDTSLPSSPFRSHPTSAPAVGRTTFPRLNVPISPAISTASRIESPSRSPFSARAVTSPFDWDAAAKGRHADVKSTHSHKCAKASSSSRTSVRHIREVFTQTITYTPRMEPAPKGKKRKVQCDGASCS